MVDTLLSIASPFMAREMQLLNFLRALALQPTSNNQRAKALKMSVVLFIPRTKVRGNEYKKVRGNE